MAKFDMQIPTELIQTFKQLHMDTEKMLGDMVQAGAETAEENIRSNIPSAFSDSDIMNCLKITKVYRTPSDGGINCKVAFYGYFKPVKPVWPKWIAERGTDKMAAELVANIFEFGRSSSTYPKHPFIRKSFNKKQITTAMLKAQRKYIPKG